jgi:hypothetical protein
MESVMKTPQAIIIGLALIAAAIYLGEPSVKPAHAALGGVDGFSCSGNGIGQSCGVLDGNTIYLVGHFRVREIAYKTGVSKVHEYK